MKDFKQLISNILKRQNKVSTASIILFVLTVTAKLFGFVKLNMMARFFGVSKQLDIFWAAFAIPDLIFSLLVVGSVNAALIPTFSKIKKEGKEQINRLFFNVVNIFVVITLVAGAILYFLIPYLADFLLENTAFSVAVGISTPLNTQGAQSDNYALFVNLSRLMLLSPLILGVSSILGALLQVYKKFLPVGLAPLMYNLGTIIGIVFFVLFFPQFGIYALAISVLLGSVLHLAIQIPSFLKQGFTFMWGYIKIYNKSLQEIIKLTIPRTIGLAVEQIAILFNTFWSFLLGPGSLSSFKFASSLHLLAIHIISGSLVQASFPILTENLEKYKKEKDLTKNKGIKLYFQVLMTILFLTVPVAVFLIVLRMPLVRLILGAGRFDWKATIVTAFVLAFFAPSVILQTIIALNIRMYYALHNTKTPLLISIVSVAVTILFSILFSNFFSHYHDWRIWWRAFYQNGQFSWEVISEIPRFLSWFWWRNSSIVSVAGLSFGISVGLFIETILSFFLLNKFLPLKAFLGQRAGMVKRMIMICFSGLIMFVVMYAVYKYSETIWDSSRIRNLLMVTITTSLAGLAVYILLLRNVAMKVYRSLFRVLRGVN